MTSVSTAFLTAVCPVLVVAVCSKGGLSSSASLPVSDILKTCLAGAAKPHSHRDRLGYLECSSRRGFLTGAGSGLTCKQPVIPWLTFVLIFVFSRQGSLTHIIPEYVGTEGTFWTSSGTRSMTLL